MDYPLKRLNNGILNALLYIPDQEKGFYRATRFDLAGIIKSVEFRGHNYFGPWYEKHDPYTHDSITGPVEEFSPVGFQNALPGNVFLKPGVGQLIKDSEDSFNKFKTYQISDYGFRELEVSDHEITFSHKILSGRHTYDYRKKITLVTGEPALEINHTIVNTGNDILSTTVSNHNFFVIDSHITGPSLRIVFPYAVKFTDPSRAGEIPLIKNNIIEFCRELKAGETFSPGFIEVPFTAEGFDVRLENICSCAGVAVKGDTRLSALYFWAARRTTCPEPYIDINLRPGNSFTWNFSYEFYEL